MQIRAAIPARMSISRVAGCRAGRATSAGEATMGTDGFLRRFGIRPRGGATVDRRETSNLSHRPARPDRPSNPFDGPRVQPSQNMLNAQLAAVATVDDGD